MDLSLISGGGLVKPGSIHAARSTPAGSGAQLMSLSHGKYMDAVLSGNCYWGANAYGTAVTTQAGLSATTPALTLYNPMGSGVYGVLLRVQINLTAEPAAITDFCLAANLRNAVAPVTTTDGTMYNALGVGVGADPKVRCYRVATLAAAPVAICMLGMCNTGLVAGLVQDFDVAGAVILDEGSCISLQTRAAAVVVASYFWQEITKP